jgi:hypothetical protein
MDVLLQLNPEREALLDDAPLPCNLALPVNFVVVVELAAVTLSCAVESVAALGSNRTCATRLSPVKSVAGRALVTLKALLELLICSTEIGSRPLLVMETFFDAVVPIFTFPKSMVAGLTAIWAAAVLVDENAPASDPQPASPRESVIEERARAAVAATARLWNLPAFISSSCLGVALYGEAAKIERMRNPNIGSPVSTAKWCCRQADAESPAILAAGEGAHTLRRTDYQQNRSCWLFGTGDDSHERVM